MYKLNPSQSTIILFYLKCYLHVESELIQSNNGAGLKSQPISQIGYDVHNSSINPDGADVVTNTFYILSSTFHPK